MRDIITRSELEAFGFGRATLLPAERVELPARAEAEAAEARQLIVGGLMALSSLAGSVRFDELEEPRLQQYGISLAVLDADTRIARARATGPMTVKEGGAETRGFMQFAEDPGAVYWDSAQTERLVGVAGDTLFAIARDERGGFIIQVASGPVHQIAPLLELRAPLAEWASASDDRWLAEHLGQQAAIGGSWRAAVGAGTYARLYEPPDTGAAATRVKRFIEGHADPHFTAPRQWARSLADGELQTLEDLALAEVDALLVSLEDVESDVWATAPGWVEAWTEVCRRRDDLEGVSVLMQETGRAARLGAALSRLDSIGRRVLVNVPRGVLGADERWRRARLLDASAWWTDAPPEES